MQKLGDVHEVEDKTPPGSVTSGLLSMLHGFLVFDPDESRGALSRETVWEWVDSAIAGVSEAMTVINTQATKPMITRVVLFFVEKDVLRLLKGLRSFDEEAL